MRVLLTVGFSALFFLYPPTAFADNKPGDNNTCAGIANCNTDNSVNNTANGGAGGAGGSGGTAVNAPVTVNTNTAKIEKGAVDVDTFNLNTAYNKTHVTTDVDVKNSNRQDQDQKQGQFQGQDQSQGIEGSANNSVSIDYRRNTASAYAGAANISMDSCATGVGAGGQAPAFGFSLNFARDDGACNRRKNAVLLNQFGFGDAAVQLLCQDEDIAKAMAATGKPCK